MSAPVCCPKKSRTRASVNAPIGTSVSTACSGWPSHVPLRKSLIGRIGRKRAVSQRWLKSPTGFAQPSFMATSRARKWAIVILRSSVDATPTGRGPDAGCAIDDGRGGPRFRYAGGPDDDHDALDRRARCRTLGLAAHPGRVLGDLARRGTGRQPGLRVPAHVPARRWAFPSPTGFDSSGLFGALIFVVGMPLVPLWGVWADKYSRKAVVIRSALVEAVVFAAVALSREPWQLALSMLLDRASSSATPGSCSAAIRDSVPRRRLGTAIALFGASGPIGFAVGPVLGGVHHRRPWLGHRRRVHACPPGSRSGRRCSSALASREVRPEVVPSGPILRLAFGALRGVLADIPTRRIFAIFFVAFLANQMTRPYVPVLVARRERTGRRARATSGSWLGRRRSSARCSRRWAAALGDRIGYPAGAGGVAARVGDRGPRHAARPERPDPRARRPLVVRVR